MSEPIMVFRVSPSRTSIELTVDDSGMYAVCSVREYAAGSPVRCNECLIADRDIAIMAFKRHCQRLVDEWRVG